MTYQIISMTLTAINTVALIIISMLILRKINKQNRHGNIDMLWSNFVSKPEHRKELKRIIEKHTSGAVTKEDYESR